MCIEADRQNTTAVSPRGPGGEAAELQFGKWRTSAYKVEFIYISDNTEISSQTRKKYALTDSWQHFDR